jgi:putative membrane protein insertion efficiency factor
MKQIAKVVALQMLRGYKWAISPLFPPACRYVPTCSEYATEAVERYGVLRGGWMAFLRLLRCHPFVRGGYDPVVKRSGPLAAEAGVHPAASTARLEVVLFHNQSPDRGLQPDLRKV